MPSDISDVLVFLLDGQFPVITDYGIMPKEDRSMKMQGKRVLSLLASRIYNETKNNAEIQVIHEGGIEKLRKSLAIPKKWVLLQIEGVDTWRNYRIGDAEGVS